MHNISLPEVQVTFHLTKICLCNQTAHDCIRGRAGHLPHLIISETTVQAFQLAFRVCFSIGPCVKNCCILLKKELAIFYPRITHLSK